MVASLVPVSRLKVLHIISGLGSGGAERMLTRLVTTSCKAQFQHVVVSLMDEGVFGGEIVAAGIPLHTLRMSRSVPSFKALGALVRLIRSERPDIIQTWLYHADLAGTLAALLSSLKVPVVWNVRCSEMNARYNSSLTRVVIKLLAFFSFIPSTIIVNSEKGQADHGRMGYRPKRWVLIPNGFDIDLFKPNGDVRRSVRNELRIPDQAIVVGHVARFDPMKDHAGLLSSALLLVREHPNLHFVMAGEGVTESTELFERYLSSGVFEGRLHLLGLRRDVHRIMAALDILVLSSAFGEGFPNVVGEAMSCGVPCLVTDVGDSAQLVSDCGFVVQPGNVSMLVETLSHLVSLSAEERRRIGAAARQRIVAHYSLENIVGKYEAFYREIRPDVVEGKRITYDGT